jgi:hypothetical protein
MAALVVRASCRPHLGFLGDGKRTSHRIRSEKELHQVKISLERFIKRAQLQHRIIERKIEQLEESGVAAHEDADNNLLTCWKLSPLDREDRMIDM